MDKNITDRRTKKSKSALRNALAELLMEKDLVHITVKELTERADVNRGTFYFHFQDIFEFVEFLENNTVKRVREALTACMPPNTTKGLQPLLELLNNLLVEAPYGMPLITSSSGATLKNKLFQLIHDEYLFGWLKLYTNSKDEKELNYCSTYIISGYFSVALQWINEPIAERESSEIFADRMNTICLNGIASCRK